LLSTLERTSEILRDAKTYVNEKKWDGTTGQLMQSHIEKCRECYVDIKNAAEHIKGSRFQHPAQGYRVYLI